MSDGQEFHSDSDISEWSGPVLNFQMDSFLLDRSLVEPLGLDSTIEEIQDAARRQEWSRDLRLTDDFRDEEEEAPMMRPYGFTRPAVLKAVQFLNSLPEVDPNSFDKSGAQCTICLSQNDDKIANARHHKLLQLPCGHRMGKSCLYLWLNPVQNEPFERLVDRITYGPAPNTTFDAGSNTCPVCRKRCFPYIQSGSDILIMRTRLRLWDSVYTRWNIPLSQQDQEVRAELLGFFRDYQSIEESRETYMPWKPHWIDRSLFLEICQYMVLYANILIANRNGRGMDQGFQVALKFLEHYRDITKPENYDPGLWFGTHSWIDEGAMVVRMDASNWENGRMLWKGEEANDKHLTAEEKKVKIWTKIKSFDLAKKVKRSLPIRDFWSDSLKYCP